MEKKYSQYPPHLIHTILQQYQPRVRGKGFKALASKYNIKGGHMLVKYWYSKWDGTELSLSKQAGGDKRSILTQKEKKSHIYDFIEKKSKKEAANYTEVQENVEKKPKKKSRSVQFKKLDKN